ncbi:hypothetical protein [uncultured Psychroserpens sp.]|uniref:hypothetical protein n=1 Tax=uncultured Psychroserpens sp. TaxID=255436 RepID=UPI00261908A8|nr:hypothetical protein [uncultured Psychroserpens sp.]
MKSTKYVILFLCITLVWSCSSDDDTNNQNPPTTAQLLVSHGSWSLESFTVLEIRDAGPSTATSQEIEDGIMDDLSGTTIVFNSDFTGTLTNPQAQSPFTWLINTDDSLILTQTSGDVINFDTVSVTDTQLMLNTETTFYDSVVDYDLEVYGTFAFE